MRKESLHSLKTQVSEKDVNGGIIISRSYVLIGLCFLLLGYYFIAFALLILLLYILRAVPCYLISHLSK